MDQASRLRRPPNRLCPRRERRIIALRFTHRWIHIGYHLRIPRYTVGRVLARYQIPRLAWLDRATGLPVCKPVPIRYEKAQPGELVHGDIKNWVGSPMVVGVANSEPLVAKITGMARQSAGMRSCIMSRG